MKKIFTSFILILFLTSFVFAQITLIYQANGTNCPEATCYKSEKCYPYFYAKDGEYCSYEKNKFVPLLKIGEKCEENSECETNLCVDNLCTKRTSPITSYATENEENENSQGNQISTQTGTENQGEENQIQTRTLTQAQIQKIKQARNRIRINAQEGECPEKCTCTGSSMKCELERGGREMTITAGNSGNTIVQVKGTNMSTKVALYKSEDKVYGEFNGETKEVRVLPDMVKNKIRERIARELDDEEIELDEEGIYRFKARKRARLFGFIPVRVKVRAEINSETGEVVRVRNSWWSFLARDETEEDEE